MRPTMVATKRYKMSLWFKKLHLFKRMMKNTTKILERTEIALDVREMMRAAWNTLAS